MWEKHCHKPDMTGNGKFIPPIYGENTWMVLTFDYFTNIIVDIQ